MAHPSTLGTRVLFVDHGQVATESFELAAPGPGEIAVRSLYSLMSTGTENIMLHKLYAPGSHWERYVNFPVYPGYSTVGVVTESNGAEGYEAGDMVAMRRPHASHHVFEPNMYTAPVPAGLDPRQAVWFALAKIAFHGARAGGCELGSRVMIIGAGPIGQMATRWVAAAGAGELTVVDPAGHRLELAVRGGATHTIAEPVDAVVARFEGKDELRPQIVIDTTGNAKVFAAALGIVARFGRVVVLGDTGFPGEQALTSDVIRRGVTIVGAHDIHNDATWNNITIARFFFNLIRRGRFDLEGMISHEFPGERAPEGYEVVNARRGETMGVLFQWGEI